jgi:hypothetical protein
MLKIYLAKARVKEKDENMKKLMLTAMGILLITAGFTCSKSEEAAQIEAPAAAVQEEGGEGSVDGAGAMDSDMGMPPEEGSSMDDSAATPEGDGGDDAHGGEEGH